MELKEDKEAAGLKQQTDSKVNYHGKKELGSSLVNKEVSDKEEKKAASPVTRSPKSEPKSPMVP